MVGRTTAAAAAAVGIVRVGRRGHAAAAVAGPRLLYDQVCHVETGGGGCDGGARRARRRCRRRGTAFVSLRILILDR